MQYAMGKRDEDHLSAAAFNIMAIIHNEETDGKAELVEYGSISAARTLNDMPKFKELKHENH